MTESIPSSNSSDRQTWRAEVITTGTSLQRTRPRTAPGGQCSRNRQPHQPHSVKDLPSLGERLLPVDPDRVQGWPTGSARYRAVEQSSSFRLVRDAGPLGRRRDAAEARSLLRISLALGCSPRRPFRGERERGTRRQLWVVLSQVVELGLHAPGGGEIAVPFSFRDVAVVVVGVGDGSP